MRQAHYAKKQHEALPGQTPDRLSTRRDAALAELPALDLPTDRPRPAYRSFRGGSIGFEIEEGSLRALKDLSGRENVPLATTLLSAFLVLLHRWSGQEDLAVGLPGAGPSRLELDQPIGFLADAPVVRSDSRGDPGFATFLARTRQAQLAAREHGDLPLDRLIAVTLDLSMAAHETAGGLAIRMEYAADLFDAATIERMAGCFRVLLRGIVADPTQPILRLPLLTDTERHRLTREWNETAVDRPGEKCVVQLIEEQVARHPAATAVAVGLQSLTYAELNSRANRLAHRLRGMGVGPEVPVAVALERSIELVVALLATLKAGGVYVPLDPDYPRERLALLLDDMGASTLLTQARLVGRVPARSAPPLCLDADWPQIAQEPDANPSPTASASSLAYVIHTSGSTGQPKGVMVEQRSLLEHLAGTMERFAAGARDCVLQTAPIGFDQSIWQMLFPLLCGARVALPVAGAHRSAEQMAADMRFHGVTILRTVPTLLAALLNGPGLRECASLRLAIVVGEALDRDLADAFAAQSGAKLMNAYGATEATMVSTLYPVRRGAATRTLPIGRPIDNVCAYVLDPLGQPVPMGVLGELCIAGRGVARGYWRRPEQTAQSFVPDPFAADPGARMYRTGDIVRHLPDGNLEFHGRRDFQVKLRGVRIELGEIEATLGAHPDVDHCVVAMRSGVAGESTLVAYFVLRDVSNAKSADLRAFLREKLPAHMIPRIYVPLPALPKTRSGKVDRKALPSPAAEHDLAPGHGDAGPRNPVEEWIAGVWADVLRLDRTGVHQDFFDLGGHSLLAMQVLGRIEDALGVSVSIREFFAEPTIAALARKVEPRAGQTRSR